MNSEKLLNIAKRVRSEFERTQIATHVNGIAGFLSQAAQNPHPSHIQQLNASISNFVAQMDSTSYEEFGSSDKNLLADLGLDYFVGFQFKEVIMNSIQRNAITHQLAYQEIAPIGVALSQKMEALNNVINGLSQFGFQEHKTEINAELSILIPRKFTNENLSSLTKEMKSLDFILRPFFELNGVGSDQIKVNSISSSEYIIYLMLLPQIAKDFAIVIDKLFEWFERYSRIRKDLQSLQEKGVDQIAINGIVASETKTLDDVIEALAKQICEKSNIQDAGRKNELSTMLKKSIKGIAERFDNGFSFDLNLPPNDPEFSNPEEQESWQEIKKIVTTKRYAKLEGNGFLQISHEEVVEEKIAKKKG